MKISLDGISKRFDAGWIFKDISLDIQAGEKWAITGTNGSGKSTLVNIISGYLSQSLGQVVYTHNEQIIDRNQIFKYSMIASASSELDEEFSVAEIFNHYKKFKSYGNIELNDFLKISRFENEKSKKINQFSSGMKQRLALSLTMLARTPLLILDEPTSFLDVTHKAWYQELFEIFVKDKTVVIASNDTFDYQLCDKVFDLNKQSIN